MSGQRAVCPKCNTTGQLIHEIEDKSTVLYYGMQGVPIFKKQWKCGCPENRSLSLSPIGIAMLDACTILGSLRSSIIASHTSYVPVGTGLTNPPRQAMPVRAPLPIPWLSPIARR